MNGSTRRASFLSMYCVGSKPCMDALNLTVCSLVSKVVIGRAPLSPRSAACHESSTELPIGVSMPRPVTTTRLLVMPSCPQMHGADFRTRLTKEPHYVGRFGSSTSPTIYDRGSEPYW